MRVLIFGDSITQGFWDIEGGWAARIRKYYDERQLKDLVNNDEPTVFNLGISGDITAGVIKRFPHEVEARQWKWPNQEFAFVFAIGINDSILENGVGRSNPEKYAQELRALIDDAKSHSSKIMFVGLTPCVEDVVNSRGRNSKIFTNQRIKDFDDILERVCSDNDVVYVPMFELMQGETQAGKKFFDDGLHPNSDGHEWIFRIVQPALDKLLNE